MALLQRFDPPAFLSDFDGIPGQREAWHAFISSSFQSVIKGEQVNVGAGGIVQLYDPSSYDPGGPLVAQAIVWNAFPKELLRRFGRARALIEADRIWPLPAYGRGRGGSGGWLSGVYRPQDEYCEWHVERDASTNAILRVTFTSEPPEYWEAMFGTGAAISGSNVSFPGSKALVLDLYRRMVSPEVELDDLIAQDDIVDPSGNQIALKGQYNPNNKWNTTHGIVHLCAPPNYIGAEIQLAGDATLLRANARGETVVGPDALICCSGYGGPDRNSDPTIGATVNALARLGAMVTLPNPVGLYMDHIDLSGWTVPGGIAAQDCVTIARGTETMIERLVVELPPGSGYTVSDIKIGGEAILYGGQIAECITVKLIGAAAAIGSVKNVPQPCNSRCCIDPANATSSNTIVGIGAPVPPGMVAAFRGEGTARQPTPSAAIVTRRARMR